MALKAPNTTVCIDTTDIDPLRDSFDPVYTASELDLDCLPMLNISQPNGR